MSPSDNDRLDSWKEIADYLGRDMRTLMRWEREKGLPVHSVPGGKRRSVYAYKHEIDAWLRNSGAANEPAANGEGASPTNHAVSATPAPAVWQRLFLARNVMVVVLAVAAILGVAYPRWRGNRGPITEVKLEGKTLSAIRPGNGVVWTYEFPEPPTLLRNALILPQESGGGVLAIIDPAPGRHAAYFFSSSGKRLWQFEPQEVYDFGAGSYGPPWGVRDMKAIGSGAGTRLAVLMQHNRWWPAQVVVLDLKGRVLGRSVNSGWIFSVTEINRPGNQRLLLAGGVSNAQDAGILAVFDAENVSGSSPEEPGSPYECKNCPPGRPLKYYVFPRSELNVLTGTERGTPGGELVGDRVVIQTEEVKATLGSGGNGAALYEFTPDMELKRATYTDRYWDVHHQLEEQGKLDHPREKCHDRNGPRGVRVWTRENGWRELKSSDQ